MGSMRIRQIVFPSNDYSNISKLTYFSRNAPSFSSIDGGISLCCHILFHSWLLTRITLFPRDNMSTKKCYYPQAYPLITLCYDLVVIKGRFQCILFSRYHQLYWNCVLQVRINADTKKLRVLFIFSILKVTLATES